MTALSLPAAGARVLVVGGVRSGLSLARFLTGRGLQVRVCDLRPAEALGDFARSLPSGVETVFGGYDEAVLDGCQAVYVSPGVPWRTPLLEVARTRGLIVSSDVDLFFQLSPAPIIGITGTNGKTTTTALLGTILAQAGRPVLVGGNIGQTVLEQLDQLTPEHWVVLELSSFQLESCSAPRAKIAVVLNLSPDHLDRHASFAAYVDAKARLLEFQGDHDAAVLNGLDPVCRELARRTRAQVHWFELHQPMPSSALPGEHNRLNVLAAACAARLAGLTDSGIEAGVAAFRGVEHRLELVGEWHGVRWYNDSKATNPDAGLVALQAFPGTPLVLIAGGYGGGFELDQWLGEVRARTQAVVLLGRSAAELSQRLGAHPQRRVDSLANAVQAAASLARPGSAVLFSPAYKSFDMFSDYEDRGRRFKTAVRAHHGEGVTV